ncbi:MAG TPA: hypothetical protein VFQ92_09705, partial [Blastocatellia bacterium]|nr:hypothetical protein [Blastocatellia bacterium]
MSGEKKGKLTSRSQKPEARSQNLSRSLSVIAERQKSELSSTIFWLLASDFWLLEELSLYGRDITNRFKLRNRGQLLDWRAA